jgi:hypothetical protein
MQTEFTCPATGASLAFELQSDDDSIVELWLRPLRIQCPVCEGVHETGYRDAYLTGLMAQFSCMPADLKQVRIH